MTALVVLFDWLRVFVTGVGIAVGCGLPVLWFGSYLVYGCGACGWCFDGALWLVTGVFGVVWLCSVCGCFRLLLMWCLVIWFPDLSVADGYVF